MRKCSFLPLSRPVKVLRNMLIAAVIAMPIWAQFGFPVPTMDLHSAIVARRMLLDPGEIVLTGRDMEKSGMLAGKADMDIIVRETGGCAIVCTRTPIRLVKTHYRDGRGELLEDGYYTFKWTRRCEVYPVEEGPTAVPLGLIETGKSAEVEHRKTVCPIAMLHVPEEAVRSELAIRENGVWHRFEGECGKPGAWLFLVTGVGTSFANYSLDGYSYELTAYDSKGGVLLQQEGELRGPDYE